ncbi:unnamed protein product, partial [Cladocopium goreaui]
MTSNPIQRYIPYLESGFTDMWVLTMSDSLDLINMLEAACISHFSLHVGCRNKNESGGEGAQNRVSPPMPPFYLYVTGGRADQPRREPMKHVVALAKAEVEENPLASPAMREFAGVRLRDAEKRATRILEKHELAAPIPIDRVKLHDSAKPKQLRNFPCMKFSSWLKFLLDTDRVPSQLCGCGDMASMNAKLREFWGRYEQIHPTHPLFQMQRDGQVDLSFMLPVSLKRSGLGMNFVGNTWGNQFMFACMLRKLFKKRPQVLDNLVLAYAQDMAELFNSGVSNADGTVTIRCCHLGTKGDLPALARMGNMLHTFSNVPRAASSRKSCEGICWMCKAGQENPDVPFEDVSGQPLWEATLGCQNAWHETPPILTGVPWLQTEHWSFFKTDIWHNLHLGIAKHFTASAFVSLLEILPLNGASMDDKIRWLDECYKDYCARKRVSPHVEEIGRDTLSWPQASSCPVGSWNKGSASTHFMKFLEDLCLQNAAECAGDPLLQAIATGTKAMNSVMSALYGEGFFIHWTKAEKIAKLWLLFLQKYAMCARLVYRHGRSRFALVPKLHMLHHGCMRLLRQAELAKQNGTRWTVNPLGESVQQQEDFIGKPSRLSRRVSAKQIHAR